jgi:hypothetical protein
VDLPLLLAGPILRRVEPNLVCVWVALSQHAALKLMVWEGRVDAGAGNMLIDSTPAQSQLLRVGEKLFVGLVTLTIDAGSPRTLQPGRHYSYDLSFSVGSQVDGLKSLGLLKTGSFHGMPVEALGFEDFKLPSFALPPDELTDLRIVFGSCRLPNNDHLDAMVTIDDVMREGAQCSHTDALKRPHQLFLGGDQIYADDVSVVHMAHLIALGNELIGRDAQGQARERLPVDHVMQSDEDHPVSFAEYDRRFDRSSTDARATPEAFLLPADAAHFPAGRRYLLTTVEAQMTTVDGFSQLFSLGEFAAMYLSVWSNAVWPGPRENLAGWPIALDTTELLDAAWPPALPTFIDTELKFDEKRGGDDKLSPFKHYAPLRKGFEKGGGTIEAGLVRHRERMEKFVAGLPRVRRVLANIPTYMVFDDHDFTDDWNLNPQWMDRVLGTSLGVTANRNALVSYALFQDWGNDPLRYDTINDTPKKLLDRIGALFPGSGTAGPNVTAANDIDNLLGLDQRGVLDPDGSVSAVRPPMKWHFSVPGNKHMAVALDNRTRRSFVSRNGPPGNVSADVLAEQIPAGPLPAGKEVLLVIAPLQVLGPPLLDELVAPASYKVFDMVAFTFKGDARSGLKAGSRGMVGTNPDAIEAWAFDAKTFEALLERLEPFRRVVLLSGDVHYSASDAMSYFKKGVAEPARFVQFTSSGFKNVMPDYITAVDRSLPHAQALVRAGIGAERLGWKDKPANPIILPAGVTDSDVPRALRARLKREPVMVPTSGWPAGSSVNPAQPPDWSWHVAPVLDLRPDGAGPGTRPLAAQPLAIDTPTVLRQLAEPRSVDAFQALAARHQRALETLRNSRQILFRSNFGLVRFERRDGLLHAIHEAFTSFRLPGDLGSEAPRAEAFMQHAAALADPAAPRPEAKLNPPLA